jgi:hypothetical protein
MRNLLALGLLVYGTVAAAGVAFAQSEAQPDTDATSQCVDSETITPPAPVSSEPMAPDATGDTEDDSAACAPASSRACADVCNGEYGMLCFWGTVCDPVRHYCEKTSP